MPRVCVIGGGTSGAAAAREAEARGARVTVVERDSAPDPPWSTWLDFGLPNEGSCQLAKYPTVNHPDQLLAEAKWVGQGQVRTADGRTIEADRIVVATGSGFELVSFPGSRKRGALILDGVDKYSELGRMAGRNRRMVVAGEGYQALRVADGQPRDGMGVSVLVTSWQRERPGPLAMAALESAAMKRGVSWLRAPFEGAVGSPSLEAVVADGEIVPCDFLAVVPRRIPMTPPSLGARGPKGGLLVGRTLKSEQAGFYAAGGCAELGWPQASRTLEDMPAMTGRVAGANCMGEQFAVGPSRSQDEFVFGLAWHRTGLGPLEAREAGIECDTSSYRRDALSACAIVYERATGIVLGAEWVEEEGRVPRDAIPIMPGISLRTLAYWSSGSSSDISLVSETARLGLTRWRRS